MSEDVAEPVEEQAAPPDVVEEHTPVDSTEEDAALEGVPEEQVFRMPEQGTYVPVSAVIGARAEAKTAKTAAAAAEADAKNLRDQLNQLAPSAEALRALQAAAAVHQQQPQPAQGPTPQQQAEAEAFAKDFDLYTAEGKPDIDRAQRIIDRNAQVAKVAGETAARNATAPLIQRTVSNDILHNFERAKITEVNGLKPDPQILKTYFDRILTQPKGMETLSDPNQVAIITKQAIFDTWNASGGKTPAPKAAPAQREAPEPVFSEKSGGQDQTPQFTLSGNEIKLAREMYPNQTEAQAVSAYRKAAAKKPW